MAHNAMTTEEVRRGVIPGSVSDAILYGKTVREAVERGEDPIEALLQVTNGYKLFQGVVSKADYTGDRGFSWWDVELKGRERVRWAPLQGVRQEREHRVMARW